VNDNLANNSQFARELWRRLESIHAVTYFAPETGEGAQALGARGFWRTYFGFRAAPLGACSAGAASAAFFGFAPSMISRAIPSIWGLASPDEFLAVRGAAAAAALRRIAGDTIDALLNDTWAMDVLGHAARNGTAGGLPLYLANRNLVLPDDPIAALWQTATTLREQRGDGHVAAWTARGFAPIDVAVLFVAAGGTSRAVLQPNRGWSDDEWVEASTRLSKRGLLDDDGIGAAGRDLVAEVELATDTLAWAPFAAIGVTDQRRLLDALTPVGRAIAQSGTIPLINPMGVRLIDQP